MATQTSTPRLLDLADADTTPSAQSTARGDEDTPRSKQRRHSSFVKHSKHEHRQHGDKHKSPRRHKSPRVDEDEASEGAVTPLDPLRAQAAISPMKPVRATSGGHIAQASISEKDQPHTEAFFVPSSFKDAPGMGGDLAEAHRRGAVESPRVQAQAVDHRSPRQRALDNKKVREASGGAPRTKFPEPEPAEEDEPLPTYSPRERGNVLTANVIKPVGAYKSPRQRVLERQQQQQQVTDDAQDFPEEVPDDTPISALAAEVSDFPESAYEAEPEYTQQQGETAQWEDYGAYGAAPEDTNYEEGAYEVPSAGDLYVGADAQTPEEGDYYGAGEAAVQLEPTYDYGAGYVVPSAEDLYTGGEAEVPEEVEYYAVDDAAVPPEPRFEHGDSYVVSSAEELYGAGQDEALAAEEVPEEAQLGGYSSNGVLNGQGYNDGYDQEEFPVEEPAAVDDGSYVVGSAEDMYGAAGGDYYEDTDAQQAAWDGVDGYAVSSAADLYGSGPSEERKDPDSARSDSAREQATAMDPVEPPRSAQRSNRYAERPGSSGGNVSVGMSADREMEAPPQSGWQGSRPSSKRGRTPVAAGADRDQYAGDEPAAASAPHSARRNVLDAAESIIKPSGDHRSPRQRALDNIAAREAAGGVTPSPRTFVPPVEHEEPHEELVTEPEHVRQRRNVLDANQALLRPAGTPHRTPRHEESAHVPSTPPTEQRPMSGRPRTGRSRAVSSEFTSSVDASAVDASFVPSRPTTGRSRKAADSVSTFDPAPIQEPRHVSSRPSTGHTSQVVDVLDQAVAASTSSRPVSSRPRTALSAASQTVGDALDEQVNLASLAMGSRPQSSRPLTGRSADRVAVYEGDVLDQAVLARSRPSSSRPRTGGGHAE
jgi:hypothetical protein